MYFSTDRQPADRGDIIPVQTFCLPTSHPACRTFSQESSIEIPKEAFLPVSFLPFRRASESSIGNEFFIRKAVVRVQSESVTQSLLQVLQSFKQQSSLQFFSPHLDSPYFKLVAFPSPSYSRRLSLLE